MSDAGEKEKISLRLTVKFTSLDKLIQLWSNQNAVEYLLNSNIPDRNTKGETILHILIRFNRTSVLIKVIDKFLNILNEVDKQGNTPFLIAARNGNIKAVTALKEKGADISLRTKNNKSALYLAVEQNNINLSIEEFFQRLKQQREECNSKVLSGTAVPNSTFRSLLSAKTEENNGSDLSVEEISEKTKSSSSVSTKQSSLKSIKNIERKEDSSTVIIKPEGVDNIRRSSIVSETRTLEELKELRDLLHKSSYVPKKAKTRRPTIEKIRSAIEKEKQNLNSNKNDSTIHASIAMSDVSTETEKKKKKRTTGTKKSLSSPKKGSSTSRSVDTGSSTVHVGKKGKKINKKKKISSKIDMEIQCSIFKVKANE